jgi:hypothetical protein
MVFGPGRVAVNKFKDHPALLSWYLIDEPDGGGYPPAFVHAAAPLARGRRVILTPPCIFH